MPHFLQERLGLALPIVQAPMAGVSTPRMAAAVSDAGALGSLGLANLDAEGGRAVIAQTRALSAAPINVNLFHHTPPSRDRGKEQAWIARVRPAFAGLGAEPPAELGEINRSFAIDESMLPMLLETRPAVVSFHFGVPREAAVRALREAGIVLFATATSLAEGRAIEAAGFDAIIAQGWEAGGHRGVFDPEAVDDRLGTFALTRLLARETRLPVIAAGGIMDGAGIAAALDLGAAAAQLGTAFVATDESLADEGYRAALASEAARHTMMTRAISGRPARCLANRFTEFARSVAPHEVPEYPIAYDLGKALHAAGKQRGDYGFGAQWAGQGAPLARFMPAAELVGVLAKELAAARAR